MELTPQGELVDFDFVDCVINSKKAMTYEDVNLILEQGEIPEDYEEFLDGETRYAALKRTFPENAETLFKVAKQDAEEKSITALISPFSKMS